MTASTDILGRRVSVMGSRVENRIDANSAGVNGSWISEKNAEGAVDDTAAAVSIEIAVGTESRLN